MGDEINHGCEILEEERTVRSKAATIPKIVKKFDNTFMQRPRLKVYEINKDINISCEWKKKASGNENLL